MLDDLVKIKRDVDFRGKKVSITALTNAMIQRLGERFPELRRATSGNPSADDDPFQIDLKTATIAAAIGHENDKQVEDQIKENMTIGETNDLFIKIMEISNAANNYPSEPSA